jgi:phosphohistidine phosphatase
VSDERPLRLLVLMRHAEAKSSSPEGDIGRELTKSGRKAAERVGQWLVRQGVRPDVVVVSPSARTRQTWDQLRAAGLPADAVWSDDSVYLAYPGDLADSIRDVPDEARTVLLIGHAPGIPGLAADLEDHTDLDADQREAMQRWPTAAVAVVSHRSDWAAFPDETTALAAFHAP